MARTRPMNGLATAQVRAAVAAVRDPELPMLTLAELGVLRDVTEEDGRVVVTLTPTYLGCPAMATMKADVRLALAAAGVEGEVRTRLSPPWSSDWISPKGRARLAEHGIAPPGPAGSTSAGVTVDLPMPGMPVQDPPTCPLCGSDSTRQVGAFGATACTTTHVCADCGEPFAKVREQ